MLESIKKKTLSERVAEQLMAHIAANLSPGDRLPAATTLAQVLGVSRPVVREALQSLSTQGVVEVVNGKGAFVKAADGRLLRDFFDWAVRSDVGTITQLMEVRKPLEVQSATLAASRRTAQELESLRTRVRAMREHVEDIETYTDLDVEFHLLIAQASHNAMMNHLIASIRGALHDAIREGLRRRESREELEEVQRLHEAVFTHIEARSPADAADAMARHFDEAVNVLLRRALTE